MSYRPQKYNPLLDPNVTDGITYKPPPGVDFYEWLFKHQDDLHKRFEHLPPEQRWKAMNPQLVKQGFKAQWSGGGGGQPAPAKSFDNPQGGHRRGYRMAGSDGYGAPGKTRSIGGGYGFNPQHQYGKSAAQKQQDYQAAKANIGNVGYKEGLKSLAPHGSEHKKNYNRVSQYNRGDRSQFQKIWDGQKLGGYSFGTDDFLEGMDKYYQMDNRTRNREVLQPFTNTFLRKDSPHYSAGHRFY